MNFQEYVEQLEQKIKNSYQAGVSMVQAEGLAGEFLEAQLIVSRELSKVDLDSRMRKTGTKALKAAIYMDAVGSSDKRPTQDMLSAIVDKNELVQKEQNSLDQAEVNKLDLQRYYDIFSEAHIFFRGISRGNGG